MKKIESFEEGLSSLNETENTGLPEVSKCREKHREAVVNFYKLLIVIEAINEGKEIDFTDPDQVKYWNYFQVIKDSEGNPGFGFSCSDANFDCGHTYFGARLSFLDDSGADFARENHADLYKKIFF